MDEELQLDLSPEEISVLKLKFEQWKEKVRGLSEKNKIKSYQRLVKKEIARIVKKRKQGT